jgi:hypothetical protein
VAVSQVSAAAEAGLVMANGDAATKVAAGKEETLVGNPVSIL